MSTQRTRRLQITEAQLQLIFEDKMLHLLEEDLFHGGEVKQLTKAEADSLIDDVSKPGSIAMAFHSTQFPEKKKVIRVTQEQFRSLVLRSVLKDNSFESLKFTGMW